MTQLSLAKRAIRLYSTKHVPKSLNRANQRSWMRSVALLGPRWLLATPLKRITA